MQRVFGAKPRPFVEAAKLLGDSEVGYGDRSVKVYPLPLAPITVVLWATNFCKTETSKSVDHHQADNWDRKSLNQNLRIEYVVVY